MNHHPASSVGSTKNSHRDSFIGSRNSIKNPSSKVGNMTTLNAKEENPFSVA